MLKLGVEVLVNDLKNLVKYPVVVEGKRDKQVLKELGFKRIYDISGKPLEEFVDYVSEKEEEVVILTDFDKEGRILASKLIRFFEVRDVKVRMECRMEFHKLFPQIKKVEELKFFLKILKGDDDYGKISSIDRKIHNRVRVYSRWGGREA